MTKEIKEGISKDKKVKIKVKTNELGQNNHHHHHHHKSISSEFFRTKKQIKSFIYEIIMTKRKKIKGNNINTENH